MTETGLYLRIIKIGGVSIPALSTLVGVFSRRYGIDVGMDVHNQVTGIISELVGSGRITKNNHRWWKIEGTNPSLRSFLTMLSDLEAYKIVFEEKI